MAASIGFPLVCQSRRVAVECDSAFVKKYNAQAPNPLYKAPLNAPKSSSVLRCRGRQWSASEHLGYPPRHGGHVPQYCVFLSADIIPKIKEFEWFDDLTEEVTVASLVYSPSADAVSMVRAQFDITATGRIRSTFEAHTHSVLAESERYDLWLGVMWAFTVLVSARLLLVTWLWLVADKGTTMLRLDIALTLLFIGFGALSLFRRYMSTDMISGTLLELVKCFLSVTDTSSRDAVAITIAAYFATLEAIVGQVFVEQLMKIVAYFLVLFSIARVIAYMSVHPRIEVIARTITVAADDIFHFLLVFVFTFGTLAWLAHWSFGPDKEAFQTYQVSVNTCLQMLVGEFPFMDEWTEGWQQKIWYLCYIFLIYFVSVNVLLAIIVEAFLRVKQRNDENSAEANVIGDMICLVVVRIARTAYRWPAHRAVLRHLQVTHMVTSAVISQELTTSRFAAFPSRHNAERFLLLYYRLLGNCVLSTAAREVQERRQQDVASVNYAQALFNVRPEQVPTIVTRVVRLQQAWRVRLAQREKTRREERKRNSSRLKAAMGLVRTLSGSNKPMLPEALAKLLGLTCDVATMWLRDRANEEALRSLIEAANTDLQSLAAKGAGGDSIGGSKWRQCVEVDRHEAPRVTQV